MAKKDDDQPIVVMPDVDDPQRAYEEDGGDPFEAGNMLERPVPIGAGEPAAEVETPEEEEAPAEEKAESEAPEEEAEEEAPTEKEIKNPWARARVAERIAREKDDEIKALYQRLEKMEENLTKAVNKNPYETDEDAEEDVDEETNPVGAIRKDIEKLREKIEKKEQQEENQRKLYEASRAVDAVNRRLMEVEQEDPVFVMAENHIGKVLQRALAREMPNASEGQRKQEAAKRVIQMKLRMAAEGRDPVEYFGDLAIDYGFDPEAAAALVEKRRAKGQQEAKPEAATVGSEAKATKGAVKKAAKSPAEEIAAAKKRQEGAGTSGGLGGSAPRRYSGHMAEGKSQRDFDYLVRKAVNAGDIQVKQGRRVPELEDLMAGLIMEVPD